MAFNRSCTLVVLSLSILLAACGQSAQGAIATGIAQTQQVSALLTQAAGLPIATLVEQPSQTPLAPIAAIATSGPAFVTVSQDTNCRSGPGLGYPQLALAHAGVEYEVIATFSNSYAVIKAPAGGGDCWLFLQYASTTDFSAFTLPTATQPPTPQPTLTATPSFDWNGEWTVYLFGMTMFTNVTRSGNTISGAFTDGTLDYAFTGTLNASQQVASGTWTHSGGGDGTFQWQIKSGNFNQFVGSTVHSGFTNEFCGWRSVSSMPSPCMWP
jgi:hypothetical protein